MEKGPGLDTVQHAKLDLLVAAPAVTAGHTYELDRSGGGKG
jgi:hypothetical protein